MSHVTGSGHFLLSEKIGGLQMDGGMAVWELVESRRGPVFHRQHAIRWRKTLPEYADDADDDYSLNVSTMRCSEDLLAVGHRNGLVTFWSWREGEAARLKLLLSIDRYYYPDR